MKRQREWVGERWPLSFLAQITLEEDIPGGARFAYTLGSAVLIIFTLQAITGILQLFFYVPATDGAYNSISYLRTKVPFGWLVHGLHYWGANMMVVLVLLHITMVFIWGAYKKPRELTWLAGVTLLLTTMAFSYTGTPLHWDQRGYRIGELSTNIAGITPVFGDLMRHFLRGGEEMGQLALSRLFGLHVAVLPLALVVLFAVHIVAMRRFGRVGPWDEKKRSFRGLFWPDQAFKDVGTVTAVFFLLITLVVFFPPTYTGPADPLDNSYIPKPEWHFLFLYEALKYFQGGLEPLGTLVVPTVLVLILVLPPFINGNPERNPLKRPIVMAAALILAAIIFALSVKGYLNPGFGRVASEQKAVSSHKPSEASLLKEPLSAEANEAVEPGAGAERHKYADIREKGRPGPAAYIIGSVKRGAAAFAEHCSSCHGPLGKSIIPNRGSQEGKVPDLVPIRRDLYDKDAESLAENIDRCIQHGSVPAGPSPTIRMPAFGSANALTQQEIANIEAYVLELNGVDRAALINPGIRPKRFFILASFLYLLAILMQAGVRFKRKIP